MKVEAQLFKIVIGYITGHYKDSHLFDLARLLISYLQFRALLKNAFFACLPPFLFTVHASDVEHLSTFLLYLQPPPAVVISRRLSSVPRARVSTPDDHTH